MVLLAGFAALAPIAIDMYLPALPLLARDLAVTSDRAAASLSIFLIGLALGQVIAGVLSDRIGRRPVLLAGVVLFVISALAAALATRFEVLLVARLVQALGACAAMVTVRAIARDRFDEREAARFFSTLTLVAGMAPLLAPLAGALIVKVGSWRDIFYLLAAFALVLLALGITFLKETRSEATRQRAFEERAWTAFGALIRNRRLTRYLLATVFNNAAFFTYVANAPVILMEGAGFSPVQFSFVLALNSVALIGAAQINRVLLQKREVRALLHISGRNALMLAVPMAFFALTSSGGTPFLLLLLFLAVGSIAPVQANTLAAGLSEEPLRAGSLAALFGSASFVGGAFASWVAASLYDGSARGMTAVIACCVIGLGLTLYQPNKAPRPVQHKEAT